MSVICQNGEPVSGANRTWWAGRLYILVVAGAVIQVAHCNRFREGRWRTMIDLRGPVGFRPREGLEIRHSLAGARGARSIGQRRKGERKVTDWGAHRTRGPRRQRTNGAAGLAIPASCRVPCISRANLGPSPCPPPRQQPSAHARPPGKAGGRRVPWHSRFFSDHHRNSILRSVDGAAGPAVDRQTRNSKDRNKSRSPRRAREPPFSGGRDEMGSTGAGPHTPGDGGNGGWQRPQMGGRLSRASVPCRESATPRQRSGYGAAPRLRRNGTEDERRPPGDAGGERRWSESWPAHRPGSRMGCGRARGVPSRGRNTAKYVAR